MELKVEKISKVFGTTTVLDSVSFSLERGQKVALVGNNGTGKSTLLKILAGVVEADSGTVKKRKGLVVAYLPQDTSLVSEETVEQYLRGVSGIASLEQCLDSSSEAQAEYERRNGYGFQHRMELVLAGLGLRLLACDRPINTLSSGQKSKVFMAGVLLSDADVLLLDEPTNNLDLPALIWLEHFLSKSEAICLVVSHDRLFLDRVVRKIMEIDWYTRQLTVTNGRYSEYLARADKERGRQLEAFIAQQEEIRRLTESARAKRIEAMQGASYRGKDNDKYLRGFKRDRSAGSGKTAKAIEKRIEHMDSVAKPVEREMFRIELDAQNPGGTRDITLNEIVAGYSQGFSLGPISLFVPYGSRLAIIGPNGSGKSTLLKTISGQLVPLAGSVVLGNSLIIGNLMQEHDNLPRTDSMRDCLMKRGKLAKQDAYALAVRYGFQAEELDKKVADLSPGGRARLLLAIFSALSVNVLLLDEPTNHLDLETLDALEEAIQHYQGTVILVSHDRYFLERFKGTDTYLITEGSLVRQTSLATYLAKAEKEAKRLIRDTWDVV